MMRDVRTGRPAMALLGAVFTLTMAGCQSSRSAPPAADGIAHAFAIAGAENRGASVAVHGDAVLVTWSVTADGRTDVYAAASRDRGQTFDDPIRVNDTRGDARVTGEQPPRAAVGESTAAVIWESIDEAGASRVRLATSTDGGRTFTPAVTVNTPQASAPRGWASVAMDAAGRPQVVWLDARRDAAASADTVATAGEHAHHMHGAGASPPAEAGEVGMEQSVFFAGAAGETRVVRGACFCCKTSVAVAPDDAIYLAWRHVYPVNLRDIAVARSTDGGRTFSEPVRVSEDHWQIDGCPEDGPSLAVDAAGTVHVAWPTFVESSGRKGVFYSYSTDGGRSFAPRTRVDDAAGGAVAHPQLAASGSRAVVVWDENADGKPRIRARAFVADAERRTWSPERTAAVLNRSTMADYPAIALTAGWQVAAWTSTDAKGRTEIEVKALPF